MKRLYLASSIDKTAKSIAEDIQKETGKKAKDLKLAFIYTAAEPKGVKEKWLNDDRKGLVKGGFNIFDYTISGKTIKDFKKDLSDADVIHVNGGNTFYLLWKARESRFDEWIKREVLKGKKIYIGSSAGSQLVGSDIGILSRKETKIYEKELDNTKAIGLMDFVVFPHWGSDKFKEVYFKERLKLSYKTENKIILLNDWQYVKVVGDTYKIVDIRD